MRRRLVWLQLLIGWLPMWAMFAVFILAMHDPRGAHIGRAMFVSFRLILIAALLGVVVQRLVDRVPWPHPFRFTFVLVHLAAALVYSVAWTLFSSVVDTLMRGSLVIAGPSVIAFVLFGTWLYVMIVGVSYAMRATELTALAEANAARAQLATLRSQLNPHFLFNALHSIVQLIPIEPRRAADAAERLGTLLRETIDEDRDLVTLREERAFVQRYLEMEQLRFGERLRPRLTVSEAAADALVPSFALLTLVENAVRHGAESSVEAVDVNVSADVTDDTLTLTVHDSGPGAGASQPSTGTGLRRLEERIAALYGRAARLDARPGSPRGFVATLTLPRVNEE